MFASSSQRTNRREIALIAVVCLALSSATGCQSLNHTERGALGGTAVGAGTGALVGNALGNTGAGAAIGAGVGLLGGTLLGHSMDERERKQELQLASAQAEAHTQAQQGMMGLTDVVQMALQHISDDVIINQIRTTGSTFRLAASDISYLKQNGVSDLVIKEMQNSVSRPAPRPMYVREPVIERHIYAEPMYMYHPPPCIGFRYSYHRHCR